MRALLPTPLKNLLLLRSSAALRRPIAGNLSTTPPLATPCAHNLRLLATPPLTPLAPRCFTNKAGNDEDNDDDDSGKNHRKSLPDFLERLRKSKQFVEKLKSNKNLGGLSPHSAYQAIDDENEGLFVRMDMPGLQKDEVKVWVEGKSTLVQKLMIEGEEKEQQGPMNRRSCSGAVVLSTQHHYKFEEMEFEMINGVLYLLLPKSRILLCGQGMQFDGEQKGSAFVEYKPCPKKESRQNKKVLYLRLNMPGFSREEVKVWVDGDKLCVRGEQMNLFESEGTRTCGGIIGLDEDYDYDGDEMEIEVKHGVLTIRLPKVDKEE